MINTYPTKSRDPLHSPRQLVTIYFTSSFLYLNLKPDSSAIHRTPYPSKHKAPIKLTKSISIKITGKD